MTDRRHRAPIAGWALAIACVLVAVACVRMAHAPFEAVKARIDALAWDGTAAPLTPALFERLRLALRLLAALLLAAAAAVWCLRRRLAQPALCAAVGMSLRAWGRGLVSWARQEDRAHLVALAAVWLLGLALRLRLLSQPMRYDEAFSFLSFGSKPLWIGLSYYPVPNNHLFHTFLVHVSTGLFGSAPWAIRLPVFLAGLAMIPATYGAMRGVFGKHVALLTAAWVSASTMFVEYSTNARGHIVVALFVMLLIAIGQALKPRPRDGVLWSAFAVCGMLGLYAVPTMLYGFGSIVVWLALSAMRGDAADARPFLRHLVAAAAAALLGAALLYSPVFIANGVTTNYMVSTPESNLSAQLGDIIPLVWRQWHQDLPVVIQALLALGVVTALIRHRQVSRVRVPLLAAVALWCIPLLVVQRIVAPSRCWMLFAPIWMGTAFAGLLSVMQTRFVRPSSPAPRPQMMVVAASILLAGSMARHVVTTESVAQVTPAEQCPEAAEIAAFLQTFLQPGDRVLATVPANAPLEYYCIRRGIPATFLHADPSASRRMIIVALEPSTESLPRIVREAGLVEGAFGRPEIVQRYAGATVFALRRRS